MLASCGHFLPNVLVSLEKSVAAQKFLLVQLDNDVAQVILSPSELEYSSLKICTLSRPVWGSYGPLAGKRPKLYRRFRDGY